MFTIIGDMMACLLWGGLLSVGLVVCLYVVFRKCCPSYTLSLVSGLLLFVLLIILFIQSFMLVGAIHAQRYVDAGRIISEQVMGTIEKDAPSLTAMQQADLLTQEITRQYPVLEPFIQRVDLAAYTRGGKEMVADLLDVTQQMIQSYLLRRILWICACMAMWWIVARLSGAKKQPVYRYEEYD